MKCVVLGAKGTLGQELVKLIQSDSSNELWAFSHAELALEDYPRIQAELNRIQPDLVINAGAYNAVDKAEDEPSEAFLINSEAVLHLARVTQKLNIPVVHYSTDYVFDGEESAQPYTEASVTNPISVYGQSKLLGEQAVLAANPKSYCLRTAVVFGPHGNNFLTRLLQVAKTQNQVDMVTDLIGCPMPAASLAFVTLKLFETKAKFGLYHAAGSLACSRYEFAQEIIRVFGLNLKLNPTQMNPEKVKAKRPLKVVLKNTKLDAIGLSPQTWQEGVLHAYQTIVEA